MSRHTLAHQTDPKIEFVVGYDRPMGAFFLQVWHEDEPDCPTHSDDCFDPDELFSLGAVAPDALYEQLRKEAAGMTETNVVRNWKPDQQGATE